MSSNNIPPREEAKRVFATEFNDAIYSEQHEEGERATRYMLLPTGEWVHRVFVIGTLVNVVDEGDNDDYIRGEVMGPTGRFIIDAGQYQKEAIEKIRQLETPTYIAITGKARTYEGSSGGGTKIRVENISNSSAGLYDEWVRNTAKKTKKRMEAFSEGNSAAQRAGDQYPNLELSLYRDEIVEAIENVQSDIAAT